MTQTTIATRYRWDDISEDRPMDLITRRRIMGERMMLSRVVLGKGFTIGAHQHANEQIAVVLSGRIRFGLGEAGSAQYEELTLEGGEVIHLPSMILHSAEALEETVVLDLFSPPSETTGVDQG